MAQQVSRENNEEFKAASEIGSSQDSGGAVMCFDSELQEHALFAYPPSAGGSRPQRHLAGSPHQM
jgi:hypothetical protein